MRFSEEEYARLQARRKPAAPVFVAQKTPKYRNRRVQRHGIWFSSAKEADRYDVLLEDQKAGDIRNLEVQPVFVLAPRVVLRGKTKPALRYFADFRYEARNGEEWVLIVEDVKSAATKINALYRAKLHLMKSVHDIDVEEV